jgi:transposase-like protein
MKKCPSCKGIDITQAKPKKLVGWMKWFCKKCGRMW